MAPNSGSVLLLTHRLHRSNQLAGHLVQGLRKLGDGRLDGRHQHLDGRVREAAHINDALRESGMQSLNEIHSFQLSQPS